MPPSPSSSSSSSPSSGTRATTRRALIVRNGMPILLRSEALPTLHAGDALIEPLRAAVSAIDIERCRGFGHDGILGHQFAGVVRDVADAADRAWIGTRVVGKPSTSCGRCELCTRGLADHCRERTVLGMERRDGCFADRFTLPVKNLVALPADVDDDHAVFACDVAAAHQTIRQLTVSGKPYVTVLGDGPLGLITAQLMSTLNASVRVIGRYSEKLALCEKWGVKQRHMDDIGRRADQDIVVECTGTPAGLELALKLVRPRGVVVLKSIITPTAPRHIDLSMLAMREISLVGSFGGSIADAVTTLRRLDVDVISLIGRRMRLDDGPAILEAALEPGALKVVVDI
ncbi:MAG: alcohol dehydrogenase catalytic domain-containing protein [Phycisphaerales bacterium]|nr:alcohol dehydrogenase catalytic domain-containing protein [Phycisphaerales bacterium]